MDLKINCISSSYYLKGKEKSKRLKYLYIWINITCSFIWTIQGTCLTLTLIWISIIDMSHSNLCVQYPESPRDAELVFFLWGKKPPATIAAVEELTILWLGLPFFKPIHLTKVPWFLILSTMLSYPLLPKFFLSKLCKGRDWGNCLRLANKQSSGLMSSMQQIQIACKSYHWHQKLESVSQPTCPQVAVSLTLSPVFRGTVMPKWIPHALLRLWLISQDMVSFVLC